MKANIILILLALTFLLPNSRPRPSHDNLQIQENADDSDPVIEEKTIKLCENKIAQQSKAKRPVRNFIKRLRRR